MKWFLFVFSLVPCFAQITASPTSFVLYVKKFGASPMLASRGPSARTITISGSGSWNISRGGSLSTACSNAQGYCFNAATAESSICNSALPTGSGPGSVILCWNGLLTSQLAVGQHTGTLTIGSTVINITLHILPDAALSAWVGIPGYNNNCTNSSEEYDTTDTCSISYERPSSNLLPLLPPPGNYVDPEFGNVITRSTPDTQNIQYSALTACSATCKYIATNDTIGNVDIYNRQTGIAYKSNLPAPFNINHSAFDGQNDELFWTFSGNTIQLRTLNTNVTTVQATYSGYGTINNGGTSDITDDNWWVFRDTTSNNSDVCAVYLTGLTEATRTAQTFCASLSGLGLTNIDYVQVTQVDSDTNKRYVVVIAAPAAHVFSVGTSSLVYEYAIPTNNMGDVTAQPHSDVGQDPNGKQVMTWAWYDPIGNRYYYAYFYLSHAFDMIRPVETGGGLRIIGKTHPGDFNTDFHFGCNWRGFCLQSSYGEGGSVLAKSVSSLTVGNPCQVNVTTHGYSTNDYVNIGGAAGTGSDVLNDIFQITVVNTNAFTIPINCTGVTLSGGSAHVSLSTTLTNRPFRNELLLSKLGQWTRRLGIHRSRTYNGGSLIGYNSTPRASLSRDGRYVIYASNLGFTSRPSVFVLDTGITTTDDVKVALDVADTSVVFNYNTTKQAGIGSIVISTNPNLTSPVVNASDNTYGHVRQYVATGLSANTVYYYRIHVGLFSATGEFKTADAFAGNGRLQLSGNTGVTVNYGNSPSLGSNCTSPCDLTLTKGVWYTDIAKTIKATVVR
jgi:hypothetical protein